MSEYLPDRTFADEEIIRRIIAEEETPFFLYHRLGLQERIRKLHHAFADIPDHQNYFPIRENPNPEILRILAESGTGVSACSYIELRLAEKCGFSGDRLLYEPARNDAAAAELARELNAAWLINGVSLIPDMLPDRIILRYLPSDQRLAPLQMVCVGKRKCGLKREQILETAAELSMRGCRRIGLALQVATYHIRPGIWARKLELLIGLAEEVYEKTGVEVGWLQIGEGPGLPYNPSSRLPVMEDEAQKVVSVYQRQKTEHRPVLHTGSCRWLMDPAGILVSRILEQRVLEGTELILDAGMTQFIRPAIYKAYRHVSILGKNNIENRKRYFLSGELPDEADQPATKGRVLPKTGPGEYCVIHDVGAGARSMTMLYGMHAVPAEFLLMEDGSVRKISERRSEEEVAAFLTTW